MFRPVYATLALSLAFALAGCDSSPTSSTTAEKKPAEPVVPEEYQEAAKALLGGDAQVLLFGDLAKNGNQQVLVANVLPNTPKSIIAGTVVTRAAIAENQNGKWMELMRCDEYLKNTKGYLGLTPLLPVTGWKLQYEDSPDKGATMYFTPVKTETNQRTLPIAVKWNPATKRYQSMDASYQSFLGEALTLENPRSTLK
jgi:hypothetical protein